MLARVSGKVKTHNAAPDHLDIKAQVLRHFDDGLSIHEEMGSGIICHVD